MVGFNKNESLSTYKIMIAGAAAGAVTRALFQPIDVIKIKFQLQVEPIKLTSTISKYNSLLQAVKTIHYEEGLKGLWAGHNPGQILSISYGIVNFTAFEILTKYFGKERTGLSHLLCGTISGITATVVSFPFDTVRTRFVAEGRRYNTTKYKTIYHSLITMVKHEGLRAPFKGLSTSLIQAGPLSGLVFLTHNFVSKLFIETKLLTTGASKLNLSGNMVAGAMSGFIAKTLVYPLDMARKRLQIQGFQHARQNFGLNFYCKGLFNCIKLVLKNEGFFALFKGWTPSVIKAVLTTASHFVIYEETCKLLS
ncbi:mitochondrial thiamine pyrophosphate carrier-like isoform X2 [Cimex lectularius]|uniref:Mitochondrial thiamine pyrophosphate carrier n=1 Tax=Cimex lectularius TaxID=79782 RepID=A0A8I6RQF6_CIMLE|nr:mitochondrial thiamine pyrophosphate carrier-like isoform X2 [Cimex lectularius]